MMCKSSSITKPIDGGGAISTTIEYLIGVALFIYTIGFLFFRIGEIVPAISHYSLQCSSALLGNFFLHRALFDRRAKYLLHIASIVAIVYFLDTRLPKPLPSVANNESYTLKTVVVTGANAGMGYETSRQLAVKYGVQVIMGCRSEAKCNNAANAINAEIASTKSNGSATPLLIDLSNLDSVKSFASQLEDTSVDVVFNNAGYVPDQNLPVNSYGLDPSFTSMHLAHFYLTEQLLNLNPKLRMVNTSSGTHHTCAIPYAYIPSFLWNSIPPTFWKMLLPQNPGCIDDDYLQNGIRSKTDGAAYIQAKLANVMHAVELPRRHPGVTSIAIDLAWVGTTIQSWMQGQLTPTNLGWMRSVSVGVSPVIHAILSSDEEIMSDLRDGREWNDAGIIMNVFGQAEEAFSYHWWRKGGIVCLCKGRMTKMGEKLWDESVKLLQINGY